MIARDSNGGVVFGGAKQIQKMKNAELAEAEGVLWVLQVCKEQELTHTEIESDCLTIINKLRRGYHGAGEFRVVYQQICTLARTFTLC